MLLNLDVHKAYSFSVLLAKSFSPFTSTLQYDLSSSQSSAFGNNLTRVDFTPNTFVVYCGDVNQDGIIDTSDLSIVDNNAFMEILLERP